MPRLKAIIFDVDGVLVDSLPANREYYALILKIAGYARPNDAAIDDCFNLPMRNTIERLTGSKDAPEVERIYQIGSDISNYPFHLLQFPASLAAILRQLHHRYRLAVVTSRLTVGVGPILRQAQMSQLFDVIVAFEDYHHPKPHPEPLQIALKKLGLKPNQAVYVGDGHPDVVAAQAAGMPSIHLAATKHRDATVGITNFDQIPAAVAQIEDT